MIAVISITILKMLMQTTWLAKQISIVKQQEAERRSNSAMPTRDSNSSSNMKPRRRLSFAETSRCTTAASMETLAHMHMVPINFKRRHIFQAISWQSYVHNSIEMEPVLMVRDVNTFTVFMISNLSWHILKPSKKELDLLNKEITKSAVIHMLTVFGQISKQVTDAVHPKNLDLHVSNKSITKNHYKRT